jgi:hypothetical protein
MTREQTGVDPPDEDLDVDAYPAWLDVYTAKKSTARLRLNTVEIGAKVSLLLTYGGLNCHFSKEAERCSKDVVCCRPTSRDVAVIGWQAWNRLLTQNRFGKS